MQKHSISLQNRLVRVSMLSSIAAGMIAFVLLTLITVYQSMSIQDEIMDEISDMLLITDITSAASGNQLDELSDEFDIQYQLKADRQILTQSSGYRSDLLMGEHIQDDYSFHWMQGGLWRLYTAHEPEAGMTVTAYQPVSVRFEKSMGSILSYGGVLLILWLVQWGIIHFAIARQFKPLRVLSEQISQKRASDLSPVHQAEPELEELQPIVLQLNRLLERLEQSLLSEKRFTADASHELRSPLSAMQMRLQVMKRKFPDMSAELNMIQQDVSRGTQILENLLMLARLDPEAPESLPRTECDLKQVIEEVMLNLEPFSTEKNIQIQQHLQSVVKNINKELIYTCIRNLVDNAIRYTPEDGQISIELKQQQGIVNFSVENSGEGLSDEVLARLGERFYRALGSGTQGTGLGLSICKKIIHLHHGELQFAASDMGGLKVCMTLK